MAHSSAHSGCGVLVPLKPSRSGKSRLAPLGEDVRRDLLVAFAEDTVSAVHSCAAVRSVLVVTDDPVIAAQMRGLGVGTVPDSGLDLNDSLVQAAAQLLRRTPGLRPVAICGDLPALRPPELASALASAPATGAAFVSDARGSGTTLYMGADLPAFRPRFGHRSRAAHLEGGAVELAAGALPGLHRDVDTPEDLVLAVGLGVGSRTSEVVRRLGFGVLTGR